MENDELKKEKNFLNGKLDEAFDEIVKLKTEKMGLVDIDKVLRLLKENQADGQPNAKRAKNDFIDLC